MIRTRSRAGLRILLSAAVLSGCDTKAPGPISFEGRTMGTAYHVRIANVALSSEKTTVIKTAVQAALDEVDGLMSTYRPESEVSRFNRSRSLKPFPVSPKTLLVVKKALDFSRMSGGAFDPTVGPLVNLWGFGPKAVKGPPDQSAIKEALKRTGFANLHIRENPPALIKDIPGLEIDLSAIAKGFGADEAAAALSRLGLKNFMVEVGGEVVVAGSRDGRGAPWRIGVDRPKENALPGDDLTAIVPLREGAMATSGSYRNFIRQGGKRLPHFIDPRTGRPVPHTLASASVLAPTCLEADAVATTIMVMGLEKAKAWLKGHPEWKAYLVDVPAKNSYSVWASEGFSYKEPSPDP